MTISDYFNYVAPKPQLTAVSLFAGVGGFDLALERNGVKVVAAAEIDKHASAVLARHFPTTHIYNDVRKVNADGLRADGFIPERGIITGGFPCQDLSVAGKRAGLAGQRSGLFYEIARIADETRAKWLVLENVPGLLTSQRGADMGAVVGTLADLGYCVAWRVLDAQHFGVPQRRRRVFIVAERAGDPTRAAQVLFERTGVRRDTSQGRAQGQETAGGAGQGAAEPVALYEPHHGDGRTTIDRSNTLNARMGTGGNQLPVLIEPVAYSVREDAKSDTFSATELSAVNALQAHQPSSQSHHAQTFVIEPSTWWNGSDIASTVTTKSDNQRMPDKGNFQAVIESSHTVYGQTGFSRYTEGAVTTLTATDHKRVDANVVVHQDTPSAE